MKTQLVVLFVDDDEFQLEFVSDMLRALGVAEVLTANGGKEGLALFDALANKPDLLLCDLSMPDMDGIEFLRHVAERGYQGAIGILSGMETGLRKAADTLARAYSLNLLGVMEKPARREALISMLVQIDQLRPSQVEHVTEASLSVEEVKAGLAQGRIEIFFQPKVAVSGRRMVGVECLARWRHPERGILGPHTFIGVAEQHGLIDELTLVVLRRAVSHLAEWQRRGHDCKIAINLSADNLNRLDLPEIFHKIVQDAGVASQQIVLEITEGGLMKDFHLSLDILTRLRLKGFSLSVDDFGTGYSNMEKLKQLPFSELKVDRTFVSGAAEDPIAHAILESSMHLGRTLGLNLVAEGVETQEDWDLIEKLGCDEVQGYFIAKPMPAAELLDWKKEWERDMNNDDLPRILNVDDDAMMRELTEDMLGGSFQVLAARNGEECLGMLQKAKVDLILLDVEMPGIDGYETCRRLKADDDLADIPVIFLSGHDHIEDRLKGYEAGGEDYIVKPFDPVELESKVKNLLRLRRERDQQKEMASYASSTAMTAMTSMSEMGALIETMKSFNACNTLIALADACLAGLAQYGLQGAVQIRTPAETLTRTEEGEASPLIVSVVNHMTKMERISCFKSRMCITYEHLSLLINNMPEEDPERYGRLRDHLAMMADGANVRVEGIMLGNALNSVVEKLTGTLAKIDEAQRQSRAAINLGFNAFNDEVDRAYISLGLTDAQEAFMSKTIRAGIDKILNAESASLEVQNRLSSLIQELKGLSAQEKRL
ncbi:MAG: EAL domain-containing protein [Sulfurimicrobium sp.]|nr:EAL domain-containing protein [Sulfurimicrobium sp.]MDP2200011.1 EAL domain-containing protein [Sulfurimicrobium sp.]